MLIWEEAGNVFRRKELAHSNATWNNWIENIGASPPSVPELLSDLSEMLRLSRGLWSLLLIAELNLTVD